MLRWRNFARSVTAWIGNRSRAVKELVLIGVLLPPLFVVLLWANAFDLFHGWSRHHEHWQLDEIVVLAFFLGLAAMVFGWRRLRELKRETSSRKDVEKNAFEIERRDVLTGVGNRKRFVEEIGKWAFHLPDGEACAVYLLDLDHFKPINDLYGHRLGDEVLRVVACRLSDSLEDGGLVARLSGDEFGLLIRYPKGSDAPARLARRIVRVIATPIHVGALTVEVGVSVGVAICDDDNVEQLTEDGGARPEALLRRADVAMYNAKAEGRGRYRFFSHAMNIRLHARLKLESEINGAIARSEIIPFYQPLVDLRSNYTVGYEALARWQHPELGLILPAEFISIAEDTGAIPDLTESLIRRGLNDAKQWRSDASISFNLSLRHFADAWLPQKLLAIVTEAGFPLRRLIFELTETSVVEKLDETRAAIQSLRNIGARVALDDFGVGYSGLQHLRELPLDIVKIDRSFVHRMTREPREINVVAAMIGMGHALGLEVAAEGIETREALDALVGLGCDVGQGNLFGAARACAEVTPREHEELASRWIA